MVGIQLICDFRLKSHVISEVDEVVGVGSCGVAACIDHKNTPRRTEKNSFPKVPILTFELLGGIDTERTKKRF